MKYRDEETLNFPWEAPLASVLAALPELDDDDYDASVLARATAAAAPRHERSLAARRAQVHRGARAEIWSKWVMGDKMVISQPLGRLRARKVLQWGIWDAGTHRNHFRDTAS